MSNIQVLINSRIIISMSHIHERAISTNCGTAVTLGHVLHFMAIVTITDIQQQYIYTDSGMRK